MQDSVKVIHLKNFYEYKIKNYRNRKESIRLDYKNIPWYKKPFVYDPDEICSLYESYIEEYQAKLDRLDYQEKVMNLHCVYQEVEMEFYEWYAGEVMFD